MGTSSVDECCMLVCIQKEHAVRLHKCKLTKKDMKRERKQNRMGFFIKAQFHLHAGAITAGKEQKGVNILELHVNLCN